MKRPFRNRLDHSAVHEGFLERPRGYRSLWVLLVAISSAFSIIPLVILTIASYLQYAEVIKGEIARDIRQLTANAKNSFEFFIQQSVAGLRLVVNERSLEELRDNEQVAYILKNLRQSYGSYVDLGLIDSDGVQRSYVGPYNLKGHDYADQDWFHQLRSRDAYFSDVFMGYRRVPHFAVAVKREIADNDFYILRATFDTQALTRQVSSLNIRPSSDAFVINRDGILQAPSRLAGDILDRSPIACPPFSSSPQIQEGVDGNGERYILGFAYIQDSPFVLMILKRPEAIMTNLASFQGKVTRIVVITIVFIVLIVLWGASYLVRRIRVSELARSRAFREMQHASKMATIGRLAAGVAHEINNPLAIINEKTGLIKDHVLLQKEYPVSEKIASLADSILSSVDRCSTVTHRFLGFAKRMDIRKERIQMDILIGEVLGFLGKESIYRDITVSCHFPEGPVVIESDRGQLQQVFLNIINNAFEAVEDGGRIDITIDMVDERQIAVTIADNGRGIAEEDQERIFEPFFTTKKIGGTGLGLSITYGIVEKLGGHITVDSVEGEGTRFTITMPVKHDR